MKLSPITFLVPLLISEHRPEVTVLPGEGFAFFQNLQYEVRFRSQAAVFITAFRKLLQVLLSRTICKQSTEQLTIVPPNMILECGRIDG